VFVGGCPRSGTTLLRTMLNCHPELALPHETRFLIGAWERRARFGDLSLPENRRRVARWIASRKKSRLERLGVSADELAARLEAAPPTIGSVLGTCFLLYARRHGKERWGDKRPSHAQHLDAIFAMFPAAQFINIVRDPRGAVASVRKIGWYDGDLAAGVDLWERSIRAVDSRREHLAPDQLLEIQYEELVADPRRVLERVAGFLTLSPEGIDAMMRFHERSDVPRDRTFHPRVSTPVTTEAVRAWDEALSPGEVAFVEHVLGEQMERYGYEPAAGETPVPAELVGRLRRVRVRRMRRRLERRARAVWLRVTYRRPVASELDTSGGGS
jgi:Sulfotransferase family